MTRHLDRWRVQDDTDDETFGKRDIMIPERTCGAIDWWWGRWWETMEGDIPTDFYPPPLVRGARGSRWDTPWHPLRSRESGRTLHVVRIWRANWTGCGTKRTKVYEAGLIPMPKFEWCFVYGNGGMGCTVFDMNCSLDGERPVPIAEVCVNEECVGYAGECEIATFCDPILTGWIWNCLLVCDASSFAVNLEFALDKFWGIGDTEGRDFLATEVFGDRAKFMEAIWGNGVHLMLARAQTVHELWKESSRSTPSTAWMIMIWLRMWHASAPASRCKSGGGWGIMCDSAPAFWLLRLGRHSHAGSTPCCPGLS